MKKLSMLLLCVTLAVVIVGCHTTAPGTSPLVSSPDVTVEPESVTAFPVSTVPTEISDEPVVAASTSGRILPLPTSEMFGLAGYEKTVFDAVMDERAKRLKESGLNFMLVIPRIIIYGTYDKDDMTAIVCCVGESYYYFDKPETQTVSIGGGTTPAMVLCEKKADGTYKAVSLTYAGDGGGWGDSVRELCGPLEELAESIINGTPEWTTTMAPAPDLLRTYIAETSADIKYVDMFGNVVPVEQYNGGV